MTKFEQLEILYKQFFNLADEMKSLMDKEEYGEALSRIQYKDSLIKKLSLTKKTVVMDEGERQKLSELEKKLIEKEKENIEKLKKIRDSASIELKKTNKSLKINNAYTIDNSIQGSILDFSE